MCVVQDPERPKTCNLFKLVHLTGVTHNEHDLQDLEFSVMAQDSYRLRRKVEMYQWVETFHEGTYGGRGHYSYSKQWSETPIDSQEFHYLGFNNPSIYSWPYQSNQIQGDKVKLGKYYL